ERLVSNLRALRAAADLKTHGRPHETELLAQLVDQVSLVGEVKSRGHVGEEHEGGRGDAGLRGVEDSNVPSLGADGWIGRGYRRHEPVEHRCRNACAPRRSNLVDDLQNLGRPMAGQCRYVQYRCIVEELHLPPQFSVEW